MCFSSFTCLPFPAWCWCHGEGTTTKDSSLHLVSSTLLLPIAMSNTSKPSSTVRLKIQVHPHCAIISMSPSAMHAHFFAFWMFGIHHTTIPSTSDSSLSLCGFSPKFHCKSAEFHVLVIILIISRSAASYTWSIF